MALYEVRIPNTLSKEGTTMIEIHIRTDEEKVETLRNYTKDSTYLEIALTVVRLEELKLELIEMAGDCKPEISMGDKEEK